MANTISQESLAKSLELLLQSKGTVKEILAMTEVYNKMLGNSVQQQAAAKKLNEDQENLSKRLNRQATYQSVSLEKRLQLEGIAANIADGSYDIAQKQAQALADQALQAIMLEENLTGVYAEQAKNLQLSVQMGYLSKEEYKYLVDKLKLQQHETEEIEKQNELTRGLANWQLELNEELESYGKGWEKLKSKIKAIATDPKLAKTILAVEGVKLLNEGAKKLGERFGEFRKSGESVTQAWHSLGTTLSVNSILLGQDTAQALEGMQDSMGNIHDISKDTVNTTAGLAQAYGVTGQTAGQLIGNMSLLPGMTQEAAGHMAEMTGRLAISNGVKPGKVLTEMAASTEEMAKFSAKGGESFARAAVGAASMGISVSKMAAAAEGLLDFENSITKQMEASVLLGREINLDKARELALNGDLAGASAEMLKNVGGEAEFNKMNLIQRKALADSMGMTVADLGKMVKNQDKFTEAQKEALQQGKSLDEVLAMTTGGFSSIVGFAKDNAMVLAASVSLLSQLGSVMKANMIVERIAALFRKKANAEELTEKELLIAADKKKQLSNKLSMGPNPSGMMGGISATSMLKGAFAMLVAAGAIWVFAKAVQELEKVKDWENVAHGILALAGSMMVLSLVASFIEGSGAGFALLAIGAAITLIGAGVYLAATGMANFTNSIASLPFEKLATLPIALSGIAMGLAKIAIAGDKAIPVLESLKGLGNISINGSTTTTAKNEEQERSTKAFEDINKAIMTLSNRIAQPIVINLDGKKVGDGTWLAAPKTMK